MNETDKANKQENGECGPGCACGSSGSSGLGRIIIGIVILVVAGGLVVRAMVKDKGASAAPAPTGFAALPVPAQTPDATPAVAPSNTAAFTELASLSELNAVATDVVGVFVFLPGNTESTVKVPMDQIQSAIQTIGPQLSGGKMKVFTLKADSADYAQISKQVSVPSVLAMVKGAGMSTTTGEITEAKVIQAYVAALSSGGCGPSSAGCGPVGCK